MATTTKLLAAALLGLALPVFAAPTASMTSPTNGALYLAPGTLPVKANASASGVGVNRVEFYANGNLIFTDTTSPYQFDWTNVAAGTYAITAKAIDNNGGETTSAPRNITVAGTNTPPTVSLSAPADNARYLNPSSVTLSVTASGPELNDIPQSVAFHLNGSLAQTITQAPWTYAATGLSPGSYVLTAVATDSQGAQTTSTPRTFVVSNTNLAPTVSLVTPTNNSLWHDPATVSFQASVNSGEANDTVSVEFFANGTSLGTRSSAPFSLSTSLSANTYTITAVATDGQGAQTTSATRTITVSSANANPVISVTAPASGANFPTAPAGFTFSATAGAGEINGWIMRVEFYVNGSLVNTDTAGPWSTSVTSLSNGTYQLTAKAVDQLGGETTTAPITVTVGPQAQGYFIHVDHLNTPRLVADSTGATVWRWDNQEPFGVNVPDENPSGLGMYKFPLRDEGTYYDKETGLLYNWNRYRANSVGRFDQADPLGLEAGELSLYALLKNNPLSFTDPKGLMGNSMSSGTTTNYWPPGRGPNAANCPPDDCRNPVTISWNSTGWPAACRPDDVMCGQAMQAAGLMPPYYPVTKTYSLDCLIKLGIGVKGTSTVGSTIVIKKAAAAGIAGAAEVAAVANNPVAMVIGAGYAANGVFEHCECKDK